MTAGTIYDLTALENTTGYYEKAVTGLSGTLLFNYCSAVDSDNYAKFNPGPASSDIIVANGIISPDKATNVEDADGKVTGITFVQTSDTTCANDSTKKNSLKTTITCDDTVTGTLTNADFTLGTAENDC